MPTFYTTTTNDYTNIEYWYRNALSAQPLPTGENQMPIINNSIVYPPRSVGTVFIELMENTGYKLTDWNGFNVIFRYNHDFSLFMRDVFNLVSSNAVVFNVWPTVGSPEYEYLEHFYDTPVEEEDMPEKKFRKKPNMYSFVISWHEARKIFHIAVPNQNEYTNDGAETIEGAYKKAHEFARRLNGRVAGNKFNVWPSIGSDDYKALIELYEACPNPSNITNFSGLKAALKFVFENPKERASEGKISNIIRYTIWKKHKREFNEETVYKTKCRYERYLKRKTGVDFLSPIDNNDYVLCHPDNVRKIYESTVEEDIFYYSTIEYAESSAKKCKDCSNYFKYPWVVKVEGETVCLSCLEERGIYICGSCGGPHTIDGGCPQLLRTPMETIFNYSSDVRSYIPKFFGIKKEKSIKSKKEQLVYGIELEVLKKRATNLSTAVKHAALATRKYAIIKSDSSLGQDGFEIVTAPATLDFHRTTLWKDFFGKNSEGQKASSLVEAWNTRVCGTHIHINRSAMTKMQLSKLLVFYHEDGNLAFLSKIAGRAVGPGATYCLTRKKKLGVNVVHHCTDHHEAITISRRNKGKTAEVRIFRGNVTKHGIMRSLEFVDATVKWCGVTGANELSYRSFLNWFDRAEVRSNYPDLWMHLMQLGYIQTTHVSKGKDFMELIPEGERVA